MSWNHSFKNIQHGLLFAALLIPTNSLKEWKIEKFSKIPANKVSESSDGLLIKVNHSASPLIYRFASVTQIFGFSVSGKFIGLPKLKDLAKQGSVGQDDYPLRIGFIVPGEKRLSAFNKLFAPDWILSLYKNLPADSGLDRVEFFNVTQNKSQLGKSRVHPSSDLLHEEFFAYVESPGPFNYTYSLKQPIKADGIWISIDGDDTDSDYSVLLSNMSVRTDQ